MKQKRLLKSAVILVVVGLGGVVGCSTPKQRTPDPKADQEDEYDECLDLSLTDKNLLPQLPESSVDTSNWQKYRSEIFGLEFKFPQEWRLHPGGQDQEANPRVQAYISSPDSSVEHIYTGGDMPSDSIHRGGVILNFDIWESEALWSEVSSQLKACLKIDNVERFMEFPRNQIWPWCVETSTPNCPHSKPVNLITIDGETALEFERLISRSNLYIIEVRLFNKIDNSLIDITFSVAADEINSHIPIINAILLTIEFDS